MAREAKPFAVAVVSAVYNTLPYMDKWFDTIHSQKFKKPWMHIIVDDCSGDGSYQRLHELRLKAKAMYNREILILRTAVNSGHCSKPYNMAFSKAYEHADYVFKVDSDDWIEPDTISDLYEAVHGYDWICPSYYHGDTVVTPSKDITWLHFSQQNMLPAFSMWRTKSWRAVGEFSEQIGYEDWDWWIRGLKMGMKYNVLDRPVYHYRQHATQQTKLMAVRHNEIVNELNMLHFR